MIAERRLWIIMLARLSLSRTAVIRSWRPPLQPRARPGGFLLDRVAFKMTQSKDAGPSGQAAGGPSSGERRGPSSSSRAKGKPFDGRSNGPRGARARFGGPRRAKSNNHDADAPRFVVNGRHRLAALAKGPRRRGENDAAGGALDQRPLRFPRRFAKHTEEQAVRFCVPRRALRTTAVGYSRVRLAASDARRATRDERRATHRPES